MISYAQNLEDVVLNRVFQNKPKGFYIDVGAHDPVELSVTKHFYDLGWIGINLEPVVHSFEKFKIQRPNDTNLNIAAGAKHDFLDIYEVENYPEYTSLDKKIANAARKQTNAKVKSYKVEIRTLKEICEQYCRSFIDFIKIDVEGYEKEVLIGADFSKYRPTMIVIEATKPFKAVIEDWNNPEVEAAWHDWESILFESGYLIAYYDGLNRYYLRKEDEHLKKFYKIPITLIQDHFSLYKDVRVTHDLHERYLNLDNERERVKSENEELSKRVQEKEKENELSLGKLAKVEEKLQKANDLKRNFDLENKKLDEKYESLKKDNEKIKITSEKLGEKLLKANDEINHLDSENKKLDEKYESLKKDNEKIKITSEKLGEKLLKANDEINHLDSENKKLDEKYESLKKDNEKIKITSEKLGEKLFESKSKIENLSADNIKIKKENEGIVLSMNYLTKINKKIIEKDTFFINESKKYIKKLNLLSIIAQEDLTPMFAKFRLRKSEKGQHGSSLQREAKIIGNLLNKHEAFLEETQNDGQCLTSKLSEISPRKNSQLNNSNIGLINRKEAYDKNNFNFLWDHRIDSKLDDDSSAFPLVTVITVVLNGENYIKDTIKSVLSQSYLNIEYIIIDGASADGTLEIIQKYNNRISAVVSEDDHGIYDAMNKGIEIANGEWSIFLNAGDLFFQKNSLERLLFDNSERFDLIYGDTYLLKEDGTLLLEKCGNISEMWKYNPFYHQSVMCRTALLKEEYFNTNYKIISDSEFIYKQYLNNKEFFKLDHPISICLDNGLSKVEEPLLWIERWKMALEYREKGADEINQFYYNIISKKLPNKVILNGTTFPKIFNYEEIRESKIASELKNVCDRSNIAGTLSPTEIELVVYLLEKFKPKTALELGVASGHTTTAILHTLKKLGGNRTFFAVDIMDKYYGDPRKDIGYMAINYIKKHGTDDLEFRLFSKKTALDLSGYLKKLYFDFVLIDANHSHPWPTFDLLCTLPLIKSGLILLHDVSLYQVKQCSNDLGPKFLFDQFADSEKIFYSQSRNIGILKIEKETSQYSGQIADSILLPWREDLKIPPKIIDGLYSVIKKHFNSKLEEAFTQAIELYRN